MSTFRLSGSIVALVTPMLQNGEISWKDVDTLVNYHLNNGTKGLVVLGTTGEAATLNGQEKERLVKQVVKLVRNSKVGVPVIVGTGTNYTATTIEQTQAAQRWGADAALVVTPYYNKPSQQGLIEHFTAVSKNTDLPIVLYNVPGRTGCDMLPETTSQLANNTNLSNIIALKEAVSDSERINQLIKLIDNPDFSLLSGDDPSFVDFMQAGGHGVISVTANVAPKNMSAICELANKLDWDKARDINRLLELLHQDLFIASNPMPIKWALFHLGFISSSECRLPLLSLESQYHDKIIAAIEHSGLQSNMIE